MGWETRLYTTISYNRKTYNSKYEVENDLDTTNKIISNLRNDLQVLATCTDPKLALPEHWDEMYDSPLQGIRQKFDETFDDLEEYFIEKVKLEILLDSWDYCHNNDGLAIEPPEELFWNHEECQERAYLDGEFVYTDKHPTQKTLLGYEVDHNGTIVSDKDAIVDAEGKFKPIE